MLQYQGRAQAIQSELQQQAAMTTARETSPTLEDFEERMRQLQSEPGTVDEVDDVCGGDNVCLR